MAARLVVEAGNVELRVGELPTDQLVRLGRNRQCHVVLLDTPASRLHAEIYREPDGRWFLRDCGSTNRTKVDGIRIQCPTPLRHGQLIAIGAACLRFTIDDAEVLAMGSEADGKSLRCLSPVRGPLEQECA